MSGMDSADNDALRERLRMAFLNVLVRGSHDVEASKWYADELAGIAVREARSNHGPITPATPAGGA